MDRGDGREAIFGNDAVREWFLLTLGEVCGRTGRAPDFQQGLAFFGIPKEELALLKKGDARKLAIANAIRLNTVVPNAWIDQELKPGHVSRVSRCWHAGVPPEVSAGFLAALEK